MPAAPERDVDDQPAEDDLAAKARAALEDLLLDEVEPQDDLAAKARSALEDALLDDFVPQEAIHPSMGMQIAPPRGKAPSKRAPPRAFKDRREASSSSWQSTEASAGDGTASMTMTMTSTTTMTMTVEQSSPLSPTSSTCKDEVAAWASQTHMHLESVRALRQGAQTQLTKHMMQTTRSSLYDWSVPKQNKSLMQEDVFESEKLGRCMVERIESIERVIRQVGLSMSYMQRLSNSRQALLHVADKRLEMRLKRPTQELIRDHLQESLEREQQVLLEVRQLLAERLESGRVMIETLEGVKDEMLVENQKKRNVRRLDRAHIAGVGVDEARTSAGAVLLSARQECQEGSESPRETQAQQWVANARTLLSRVSALEQGALRFCSESDTAHARAESQSDRANQRTCASIKKRLGETFELKKQLEKELRETGNTIMEAERSLELTQKQLDKSPTNAEREHILWTKDVLEQLRAAEQSLRDDLQSKTAAWKIDEACSKLTPVKELDLEILPPRKPAGEGVQLPSLKKRGPPLKPEILEKLKAKIKAAAYTGHAGRQLDVIFSRFDKDGSGQLDDEEVKTALRRTLRIPPASVPDSEIFSLCGTLDTDKSGSVSIEELIAFVGAEPEVSKRTGKSLTSTSLEPSSIKKAPPPLEPEVVERVRARIKGAAYTGHAGRQLDVIFGRFDNDGSGQLETDEVRRALRRTLRIPASMISDQEISRLCAMLDADRSGSVSIEEIVKFVGEEPEVSKRSGKALSGITERAPKKKTELDPEVVEQLRAKIKAAAYTGTSGRQLDVIFGRFDKDGSGQLEVGEVRSALRRTLRIPASVVSDAEISMLCNMLDADHSGSVSVSEIVEFVGKEPEISRRTGRDVSGSLNAHAPGKVASPRAQLSDEAAERIRARLKAAAYTGAGGKSGQQLDVLFSRLDKDGSGQLEHDELRGALRHTLKIPPADVSDAEVKALCETLDADGSGTIGVSEIVAFVGEEREVSQRTGRTLPKAANGEE